MKTRLSYIASAERVFACAAMMWHAMATWVALACCLACSTCDYAIAQTHWTFERGITGSKTFRYEGPTLRAKIQRETDTPLVVRLQSRVNHEYEVRFIGNVTGRYDLGEWLELASGATAEGLPSLPIEIVSTLPHDQRSDLFEADGFQPRIQGGYRLSLVTAILAWLAIPILVAWRRFMSKPKLADAADQPPAVSLIDQLRPLVSAAVRGELNTNDKARLELLLLHYWRQEQQLPYDMAASIRQLRQHPQAGPMITAVETWLHGSNSDTQAIGSNIESDNLRQVLDLLRAIQAGQETADQSSVAKSLSAGSIAS